MRGRHFLSVFSGLFVRFVTLCNVFSVCCGDNCVTVVDKNYYIIDHRTTWNFCWYQWYWDWTGSDTGIYAPGECSDIRPITRVGWRWRWHRLLPVYQDRPNGTSSSCRRVSLVRLSFNLMFFFYHFSKVLCDFDLLFTFVRKLFSLVGLAATMTAVGDFLAADPSHASTFHTIST